MNLKKRCILFLMMDLLVAGILYTQIRAEHREENRNQNVMAAANIKESDRKGRICLTFDDGPSPVYTKQLLDGLAERGVVATFFVTGKNVDLYPKIIKRMQDEGHLIGNHTYHHTQLTAVNADSFETEITRTNASIRKVTGEETIFIRPPYGSWDKKYEKKLNMFPVLWTIDPLDWCSTDADCVARKVVTKVRENDIILLHDCYDSSVKAAFLIVDELKKQGYEFVTVDEILFD
ncbi:MAG: polysaccharide deacetylase family protein [Lachnospiraceae bacterium]